ncbi:NfeD family protein [Clostridium uliginosum]|uniref:NfeD family protein n=1 Tax=Clostridium uliginosum TaxID=119641 RepID=UPI000B7F8803|nr:NfeD family protein [Clostridium uliginosum]
MTSLIFWIVVGIAVFLLDIFTSSFLFVWFSIGAIAAFIAGCLNANFVVQAIIFLVVSIIAISIGYPWIRKKYKNCEHRTPLMEENYIGRVMIAEKDIESKVTLKVSGIYWTGINEGDLIHEGENFVISGIQGTKLKIKKVEEEK